MPPCWLPSGVKPRTLTQDSIPGAHLAYLNILSGPIFFGNIHHCDTYSVSLAPFGEESNLLFHHRQKIQDFILGCWKKSREVHKNIFTFEPTLPCLDRGKRTLGEIQPSDWGPARRPGDTLDTHSLPLPSLPCWYTSFLWGLPLEKEIHPDQTECNYCWEPSSR